MIPVLFLVTFISFALLRLSPGDPALMYAGIDADLEVVERVRHDLGLDQPLPVQYVSWLAHVVHGDLGVSFAKRQSVGDLILQSVPRTLELGLVALALHATIALVVGVLSALRRDTVVDLAATSFALALVSLPSFVVAFGLLVVFSLTFRILPPGGFVSFSEDPIGHLRTLALPALAVGSGTLATLLRQTRSSLLEVLDDDYIRTARAKGLRPRVVITRHALRNALIPVITIIGLQIGGVIEGAFIVETIFAWPGVGRLTVDGINMRDYAVVQGTVLVGAVSYMLSTLVADLVYAWLDPRISYGEEA
jgi:peptide/nickel transport system permease protein